MTDFEKEYVKNHLDTKLVGAINNFPFIKVALNAKGVGEKELAMVSGLLKNMLDDVFKDLDRHVV